MRKGYEAGSFVPLTEGRTMRTITTEVWAVPGEGHIIDEIHPVTGLTCVYGRDEAGVKALHPEAVRVTWEAWRAEAAARQQTPVRWVETTAHEYDRMLNILPPAIWVGEAFMVGEPHDHCFATGAPRFQAYRARGGYYARASRPMTIAEFRQQVGSGVSR